VSGERITPLLRAALRYATLVLIIFVLLVPIYWIVMSSLRPPQDIFRNSADFGWQTLIPNRLTLDNYREILHGNFPRAIFNSLFVCVSTVTFSIAINSLAGFAFAVFEFPFKRTLFVFVLFSFMMPFEAIVIPLYALMRTLNWVDTYGALIFPDVANGLVIFLFRQFFAGIPKEIYEAARVDGASWWQIYLRITMPLSGPTIAAAALMVFIHQWDSFFWPLIVASSPDLIVVQVAIARNIIMDQQKWGELFASASAAVLIAMIPFLFLQRYYIRVVALGSDR